ncbi:MAG: hypothetical protein LBL70_02525 [Treponema sp.]|jgi:hypothetical protein|nr:hypothetical protein [Treponema sp.]
MRFFVIFSSLLVLLSGACSRENVVSVAREEFFSLDIGRLEDQLALYNLEGDRGISRASLAMRDGLFYISDGNGQKIARYNSYGDLLFMIYNEESNPPPRSLRTNIEDSARVTRWAFSYPLRSPGKIVVDSRKHIYVEEQLPDDRYGYDGENRALLDSIVLHFDGDGRFVEYLGQGGIGGRPFPRITGLYSSAEDDLVVVCRLPTGWNIYRFDSSGSALSQVQLKNSAVPIPPDWPDISSSVDAIMAAPDNRSLYVKVDYYRDTFDESTNTRTGNEPYSSIIWIMNENGVYTGNAEIPLLEHSFDDNGRKVSARMLYFMLGVIRGGRAFLGFPEEGGYSLVIMDTDSVSGESQRHGAIQVNRDELQLNSFNLSPEGILSALLVSDYKANLVWWRTDKMLGEAGQ